MDCPKVCKKKILCLYSSPTLKVHSTKTGGPLRFSELGKQRASKNSVHLAWNCVFKDCHLHHVQSLEEKLEDLASLSLNYWLTKFAQEVANKNEIVNSARLMFTEFRNAFELHCKRKCKQQTIEVIKLCIAFSNLFPNTRVWISEHAVLHRGIKVHPCDLNAGTQLVYHLMNY